LIEDYRSGGSAESLRFLALLWWDQTAQVYRLLTCANNDGCNLRGIVIWEGKELVNSWEETVDGKTAQFKDSFVDIQPSSFRLASEGSTGEKTIWRVTAEYTRISDIPFIKHVDWFEWFFTRPLRWPAPSIGGR
jgi:hypothetical protein